MTPPPDLRLPLLPPQAFLEGAEVAHPLQAARTDAPEWILLTGYKYLPELTLPTLIDGRMRALVLLYKDSYTRVVGVPLPQEIDTVIPAAVIDNDHLQIAVRLG